MLRIQVIICLNQDFQDFQDFQDGYKISPTLAWQNVKMSDSAQPTAFFYTSFNRETLYSSENKSNRFILDD